jgi:hypothetical protein
VVRNVSKPDITIYRWYHDDCTIGRLEAGDLQCFTLELPWQDNKRNISCIPKGEYPYRIAVSPKFGRTIHVDEVPDRSHILIHPGNYTTQIQGCILPGDSIKWLNEDSIPDVTNSRSTMKLLMSQVKEHGIISIY